MRTVWSLFLLLPALAFCGDLPLTGLAHVGFRVSDLEKARSFYTGILGYEQPFAIIDDKGEITMAFFKVNDEQYIEISPGLRADQDDRLTHIAMATSDIQKLHRMLAERGLAPTAIKRGRDGNQNCSIADPDGHRVEFVQYMPGSWHTEARGKYMSSRRISDHMWHTGVSVADEAKSMAFYRDRLGFQEIWRGGPEGQPVRWINMRMPGARGDYVELMLHSEPPTRAQVGSMHHICLTVPDIQASHKIALERGVPDTERYRTRVGRNRRRQLNLFDADGTRTELMEPQTVD